MLAQVARRYMSVYCNGIEVRTFGGNGSDVKRMVRLYQNMTKEEFLAKHPKFIDVCKDKFNLIVIPEFGWKWTTQN